MPALVLVGQFLETFKEFPPCANVFAEFERAKIGGGRKSEYFNDLQMQPRRV
jgi:hypothetical protein